MKGYFRLQEWMGFRELSAGLKRRLVTFYIDSWRCSGDLYNEKVIARCISFKEGSGISTQGLYLRSLDDLKVIRCSI